MSNEGVRLLIVDDSRIFRTALAKSLADVDGIEIVGSVWSGEKALAFLAENPVDVITLDVEMPGMNGIETLEALQRFSEAHPARKPPRVIMLSAFTRRGADVAIRALEAGAYDFVTKPDADVPDGLRRMTEELVAKIRSLSKRRQSGRFKAVRSRSEENAAPPERKAGDSGVWRVKGIGAIVIGCSTGGPKALTVMLPGLCRITDLPILIVQHMPPTFTKSLAENLDKKCAHAVVEAGNQEPLKRKTVYIAPGGRHMLLRRTAPDRVFTILTEEPPENGCRPATDVLFRSTAAVFGGNVVAVVLTGMGCDGTKGLAALKRAGATTVAQDEESSVVWGMPGSAVNAGYIDHIAALEDIPQTVVKLLQQQRA